MTITDKQLEANRENAKLGGVKTEEGKAVSRLNALKHGLLCSENILTDEDKTLLREVERGLQEELQPVGALEIALVDRMASCLWRWRRAMKVEREMIYTHRHPPLIFQPYEGADGISLGEALSQDFAKSDTYGKFTRYETSSERGFFRALHELQRLQAMRNGRDVPTPIALDVDIGKE